MSKNWEKIKNIMFKVFSILVNIMIFLSIILTVSLLIIILFFVKQSIEKFVALYIFGIIVLLFCSILFEQKLEKKGKTKIFYKKFSIYGFLYWVFVVFEVCSLALYGLFSKGIIHENKEGIYFSLYMGICVGTFLWFVYHFKKKNTDYKTFQMILQPFVLIVTIWGYVIDIFGTHKNCAIFWAALILTISFFINLVSYTKEQKKKEIDIVVEKSDDGYDVILNDENGESCHYKVTLKE